jgi:hypothetical protein
MTHIKVRVKYRRDPKPGQEEGDWFDYVMEVRPDQIIGFCRNRDNEGLPPQIILSEFSYMLAEGESVENILKQKEEAEKKEELKKFDFLAETIREGIRRSSK